MTIQKLIPFLVLIVTTTMAGCDKELLAGGQTDVEVTATDRPPPGSSASLSPSSTLEPGRPSAQILPQLIEGTVEIVATVSLVHTSGNVVSVVTTPATAIVAIGANQSVPLGIRKVPDGRYTIARVSFTRVRATLTAGPGIIGTRTVDVAIGAQPLVVERLIDLVAGVTEKEKLEIDMNTSLWVLLEQGGLVDPQQFASQVQIRTVF